MALPIAVQVYSVREDAKADLRGTLEKIKAMGYDGVEFAGLYGHDPALIAGWCRELGLTPISAHVPFAQLMENPHGTVAQYATIGCPYIAIPHLGEDLRPGSAGWSGTVEDIKMIAEECRAQSIQLLYHNHDFEFIRLENGEYGLDQLFRLIPTVETEIDTCWVNVAGENPSAYVRKYTGRSPIVHLKDFVGQKTQNMYELIGTDKKAEESVAFEFRPVGYGKQDFPAILSAAQDAGARWVVVEQDRPSMDKTPMESIEMSINYLRSFAW